MNLHTVFARRVTRRQALGGIAAAGALPAILPPAVLRRPAGQVPPIHRSASADTFDASVPRAWFALMLRLIQATPGYTPPVASRAIGCAALALYEAVVPGMPGHRSLAGSVTDLPAATAPGHSSAAGYHWPSVANAALAAAMRELFSAAPAELAVEVGRLEETLSAGVPRGVQRRSSDRGREVAASVLDWSRDDGGHEGYLRNFPTDYVPPAGPGAWTPTPPGFLPALQPYWGGNRPMASPSVAACDPGPPPAFSTDAGSGFLAEALEVYDTVNGLTAEQRVIAEFWADDPGRTATPPGHSLSILGQVLDLRGATLGQAAEAYAKVGIAVCDAFIACWQTKYVYNLLRPISYIREHIDRGWGDPLPVGTPPFPEYTSGHSVQSGAAATVLTGLFGDVRFTDHTHDARGLAPRTFATFEAFAQEAAISRLYGGIHFRAAIERGVAQGRCVGEAVLALRTRA